MNLRRYNDTQDVTYQNTSIKNHEAALEAWKAYAQLFTDRFIIERLPRIGVLDPVAFISEVANDINIVKKWTCRTYR